MSQLIARILLTVFMIPVTALVYIIAFFVLERTGFSWGYRDVSCCIVAGLISWAFLAMYWIGVWFKVVHWTATRVNWTLISVAMSLLAAWLVGMILSNVYRDFGAFVGSITAPILWVVMTVLVWRETTAERAARMSGAAEDALVCPVCGYNLTGLSEPRCPECGTRFTLSELLSRQPGRKAMAADKEMIAT